MQKMIPVETALGIRGGEWKSSGGDKFKYLIHCKNSVNATMIPLPQHNSNKKIF
jgi:hypothetical protein